MSKEKTTKRRPVIADDPDKGKFPKDPWRKLRRSGAEIQSTARARN